MLSLSEEIFLLSLLEKKETIRLLPSLNLPFIMAGAMLMELVLSGCARVEEGRLVLQPEANPVQPDRLHTLVQQIQKVGKPKKLDHWVYVLGARANRLSRGYVLTLITKGVLREDGKYYCWQVPDSTETARPASEKYLLKRRLRDAVFCDASVDEHFVVLLRFMETGGILEHIFTQDEIIFARKQIKALTRSDRFDKTFLDLLDMITTAVELTAAAAVSV